MKVKTPGGAEYEVPERAENLFAEAQYRDPLESAPLVRVIQRLEYLLEETESSLRQCHDQRHYVSAELADVERRLLAAEAKIDALALSVPVAEAGTKGQWP